MPGSALSMARVPLRDVLPPAYPAIERELRRLADELDSRRPAADRASWQWHPQRPDLAQISDERGIYLPLIDTTITLYNTDDDWLELALDIGWLAPPKLSVTATVEVACWCPRNHNMHQVREVRWQVANSRELVDAFAAGAAMLIDVLESGPFDPGTWRSRAGLPDVPEPRR